MVILVIQAIREESASQVTQAIQAIMVPQATPAPLVTQEIRAIKDVQAIQAIQVIMVPQAMLVPQGYLAIQAIQDLQVMQATRVIMELEEIWVLEDLQVIQATQDLQVIQATQAITAQVVLAARAVEEVQVAQADFGKSPLLFLQALLDVEFLRQSVAYQAAPEPLEVAMEELLEGMEGMEDQVRVGMLPCFVQELDLFTME
jgi:hypothetical protein